MGGSNRGLDSIHPEQRIKQDIYHCQGSSLSILPAILDVDGESHFIRSAHPAGENWAMCVHAPPSTYVVHLLSPSTGDREFPILPSALVLAWTLLTSPFHHNNRHKNWKRVVGDKQLYHLVERLNTSQLQWLFGTTLGSYETWAKANKLPVVVDELGQDGRLLWIGERRTDKVILFLHGMHDAFKTFWELIFFLGLEQAVRLYYHWPTLRRASGSTSRTSWRKKTNKSVSPF